MNDVLFGGIPKKVVALIILVNRIEHTSSHRNPDKKICIVYSVFGKW